MKIAIIGSRTIVTADIGKYVNSSDEIVSGGARGVDSLAEEYAKKNNINLTVFLPEYEKYGRGAPIVRNRQIIEYADEVIAFWDGVSRGTLSALKLAKKLGKPYIIIGMDGEPLEFGVD